MNWKHPDLKVASDPDRRAARRLLQGWWREQELGLSPGRDGRGRPRNNLLPCSAVSEDSGLNFLTPEVFEYVEARVPVVLGQGGTIDVNRLRRNLLSSMPMCFNLFGMLRAYKQASARILTQVTGLDVARLEEIEVEWTPQGKHPLGDRTAFDAWVTYRDSGGSRCFFGVETKYTEPFTRRVYDRPRYHAVSAWDEAGFLPGAAQRLKGEVTNQLWRNALLAVAVRRNGAFKQGTLVVVGLEDDPHIADALTVFRTVHERTENLVRVASLESFIEAAGTEPDLAEWSHRFRRRYLDLTPVQCAIEQLP